MNRLRVCVAPPKAVVLRVLIQGARLEEKRREVPAESFGNAPIYTGYVGTILILGGAAALLYFRFDEWWPLYRLPHIDPNVRVLTLSEMGDVLAGISAPLAFLWLFVATWLQRQELALQRKELVNTRMELERAADESHKQTELMNKTLATSISREIYDQFSLELYYLARILKILLNDLYVVNEDEFPYFRLFSAYKRDILIEETSSIDSFSEEMIKFENQIEQLKKYSFTRNDNYRDSISKLELAASRIQYFIEAHSNSENRLCGVRIQALRLSDLLTLIEQVRQTLK